MSRNVVDLRRRRPGGSSSSQAALPLRPQKRVSPVRMRRRRVRAVASSILAALLVAGVLATSYASYLPRYSVRSVEVNGAQTVSPRAISEYAESIIYDGSHHFFSRANIFMYPKGTIEKDIPREFPRIASATVGQTSLLSNSIAVNVVERQPFAVWCKSANADCYTMDTTGFIFARSSASGTASGQYIFSGGVSASSSPIGQTFAPGHTQGLVAFLQLLDQSGFTPLGATVQSDQDFTVPLAQGFSVYASFGEDPATLAGDLQLVLSSNALAQQQQNLDYIDLRFGNKVYYKMKGEPQQQSSSTSK